MNRIDHIVISTLNRTDQAAAFFKRMGFTVTPRGYHTLGSINHTIVFKTDYLELLGYPAGEPPEKRPELVQRPAGLTGIMLKTDDADQVRTTLTARGLTPGLTMAFSRPVDLENGKSTNVAFRVTRLQPDPVPNSWLYYCQHLNPELVWRPEWQAHDNGCIALTRLQINVSDPQATAKIYMRAMDIDKVVEIGANRCIIHLPSFEITLTAETDKPLGMNKLTVGTDSLNKLAVALANGGVDYHEEDGRIVADSLPHIGCVLEFESIPQI